MRGGGAFGPAGWGAAGAGVSLVAAASAAGAGGAASRSPHASIRTGNAANGKSLTRDRILTSVAPQASPALDAATGDEECRQRMRAAWAGARRRTPGHSGRGAGRPLAELASTP